MLTIPPDDFAPLGWLGRAYIAVASLSPWHARESTQAAISDTYNGDGKVYAALRAAAYVSWEILSVVFTDADW